MRSLPGGGGVFAGCLDPETFDQLHKRGCAVSAGSWETAKEEGTAVASGSWEDDDGSLQRWAFGVSRGTLDYYESSVASGDSWVTVEDWENGDRGTDRRGSEKVGLEEEVSEVVRESRKRRMERKAKRANEVPFLDRYRITERRMAWGS
jgi:hypothetical protein